MPKQEEVILLGSGQKLSCGKCFKDDDLDPWPKKVPSSQVSLADSMDA